MSSQNRAASNGDNPGTMFSPGDVQVWWRQNSGGKKIALNARECLPLREQGYKGHSSFPETILIPMIYEKWIFSGLPLLLRHWLQPTTKIMSLTTDNMNYSRRFFSWFFLLSFIGNSLVVQWLGLHAPTARSPGSIPGEGTKIPQAMQSGPKKKSFKIFKNL